MALGALCCILGSASAQYALEMKPQSLKVYLLKSEGVHAVKQTTANSENITSQVINVGILMQTIVSKPDGSVFQLAFKDIETTLQGPIANVTYNSAKPDSLSSLAHQVMSRFFEKVRRMRPVVTFAADGSVAALTGFDSISFELEKTFPDEAAIIALVTQSYTMFTPKGFKEFLEMQFKVLPSSPVKAKGSWKSDVSGSVMGIASEAKNTYKVVTVEGDKITTEVSTNLRMKLPQALIATSGGRGGRGGMMGMGMPGGMGGGMPGGMPGGMGGGRGGMGGMGGGMRGGMGGMGGGMRGGMGGGFFPGGGGFSMMPPSEEQMIFVQGMMEQGGFGPEVLEALRLRMEQAAASNQQAQASQAAQAGQPLTRADSLLQIRADSVLRVANQKLRIQNQINSLKTNTYDLRGKQSGTMVFDLQTGFPVSSDLSLQAKGNMGIEATALPVEYFGTLKNSFGEYRP